MDELSNYDEDSDEERDTRLVKWIDGKFLMPISDRKDIEEELASGVPQEDNGIDDTQIARLRFVQGYEKVDPPEGCEEMEYRIKKIHGKDKKLYKYNFFEGQTHDRKPTGGILSPAWIEDIFDLVFVELVCLADGQFVPVPIGSASDVQEIPSHLRTEVPIKYRLRGCDFCFLYSVASAIFYMGYHEESLILMSHAPKYSNIPGGQAITDFIDLMKMTVRDIARPTYYNRKKNITSKEEENNDCRPTYP